MRKKYVKYDHININELVNVFSKEERKRITLMHFNDEEIAKTAISYGSKIAKKLI